MLRKFRKNSIRLYNNLIYSIAFVPILISVLMVILAFATISLHQTELSETLTDAFPWLKMRSANLASAILTTLLAGTISLTVFSFSMVMVVLNQAASNYTPKILGQIVQDRHNQVVLGFYIGSILYFIVLLVNFTKEDDALKVPDIAFFLSIIIGIIIIILFVKFIHHITITIQVKQIIQMLYSKTKKELKEIGKVRKNENLPKEIAVIENNNWVTCCAQESGYFQNVMKGLVSLLSEKDLIVKIEARFGEYIIKGNPLFSSNKNIDLELQQDIASYCEFFAEEVVNENYFYGFRQITEIAVKALSPSVNDPGTAIICIDTLTDLLSLRSKIPDLEYKCDDDGNIRIIEIPITYQEMLINTFTPIRNYGKSDFLITFHLLYSIQKLAFMDLKDVKFNRLYAEHAMAIISNADENLKNPMDRNYLNNKIRDMNKLRNNYFSLPLLPDSWR